MARGGSEARDSCWQLYRVNGVVHGRAPDAAEGRQHEAYSVP